RGGKATKKRKVYQQCGPRRPERPPPPQWTGPPSRGSNDLAEKSLGVDFDEGSADALDRKKLAAFSALGGGFLLVPVGDGRCDRRRGGVGNAGGNARQSLTNAPLAAARLLHRRSPTAPCSKGLAAASRLIVAASTA